MSSDKLTINDFIIKTLDETKTLKTATEISQYIINNYDTEFSKAKKPEGVVNKKAGLLIEKGDSRIKRTKIGNLYHYYLSKYEAQIDFDNTNNFAIDDLQNKEPFAKTYSEKSLHKLLVSFLRTKGIYSKTIDQTKNIHKDDKQKWTNPDIIGVEIEKLNNDTCISLVKEICIEKAIRLYSFELKKEITNDSELKMAYFQAVSNSSWANYGYLVALEIKSILYEEMERLNQAHGIGVIELKANPYMSKIRFQAKYKDLDVNTIDKLCKNSPDEFGAFIRSVYTLLTGDNMLFKTDFLHKFSDECFDNNSEEIKTYCNENNIPFEDEDFEDDDN